MVEFNSVYTIVAFAITIILFFLGILKYMDKKFADVKKDFDTVWNKFDLHKEHVSNTYVKKEIYAINHEALEKAMIQQYSALKDLLDEKMKHIISCIHELKNGKDAR